MLSTRFDNELSRNLVLLINNNWYDIGFMIFSPFSFVIGTNKAFYFLVVSSRQLNSSSDSFASSFKLK